jgi:hypothetical protein
MVVVSVATAGFVALGLGEGKRVVSERGRGGAGGVERWGGGGSAEGSEVRGGSGLMVVALLKGGSGRGVLMVPGVLLLSLMGGEERGVRAC